MNKPLQTLRADAAPGESRTRAARIGRHVVPTLIGLVVVAVITTTMMAFKSYFVADHLIFIYLLPVTGVAMYFGSTPAVVTSIVSIAGVAYFLFPPDFSFLIDDRLQVVELIIFSALALIASKASSGLMR